MSYVSIAEELPQEFRLPFLKFVEAFAKDLRDQLAVRREDFDELTATVRELAEAQKQSEQRLGRLEVVVQELAEAQKRTEQRVAELTEAQTRTEQHVDRLEVAMRELAEAQKRTEEAMKKLADRQSSLVGDQLERRYRERAYAHFGRVLRRAQVISLRELEPDLERHLTEEEMDDLSLLDVLVRGQAGRQPDAPQVWLAIEVSTVVDRIDVARAQRRAALLRKAGYTVIPAVAGEEVTEGGDEAACRERVFVVQDGRRSFWEEALAKALSEAPPA